ncbi:hypothetical protein ABMA75_03805 [Halobacteriovorax sp. ZH4_bin.1]|uniref:hypothetical protein n=2 Tax=Halobacteriovorax TaxID=1652133 RepID=UPI003714AF8E
MKLLLSLLFLSSLLSLQSCNQTTLGAATAVKNLITTPYRGAKTAISNYQYNQIKTRSETAQEKQLIPETDSTCIGTQINSGPSDDGNFTSIEEIFFYTREQVCECKAWGSCTNETCSCETLCPNNFNIFKRNDQLYENSNIENSMAFRNYDSLAISDIEGTQGYCWGHASLTSKFNRLAFFDETKKDKRIAMNGAPDSKERKESIEYYKKIIDDIADNKVRDIPGFKNLYEFSAHPELQSYIATKMAKEWADKAMTFQGLKTTLSTTPMAQEKSQQLLEDIKKKIDNNQQPQLVFTKKDTTGYTHAVLISHYRIVNGEIELCVRDNDVTPLFNYFCQEKMKINEKGNLEYSKEDWGELGGATIAHNDNADAAVQFEELRSHCADQKKCPLTEAF